MNQLDPPAALRPSTDVEASPVPPRFWWLKRLSALGVLLVAILLAVRLWWGWYAQQRLDARITALRARGEPVTFEDFQALPGPVPDADNAAKFYMQAASALPAFRADPSAPADEPPVNSSGRPDLVFPDARLENYAEALRLVHEARFLRRADWGVRWTQPVINMNIVVHYTSQRELARVLIDVAVVQHCAGDDAAAVETLLDAEAHVSAVRRSMPGYIAWLVANACEALRVYTIQEDLLPDLCVHDSENGNVATVARATRAQIVQLVAGLLDDEQWNTDMVLAAAADRMVYLDYALWIESQLSAVGPSLATPPGLDSFMLSPAYLMDISVWLDLADQSLNQARALSIADADAACSILGSEMYGLRAAADPVLAWAVRDTSDLAALRFRLLAKRKLVAAALAIRLFELDHGHRPAALDELVPDYLPGVPIDPFSETGEPIRYVCDEFGPRLYSIGTDLLDGGGIPRERNEIEPHDAEIVLLLDAPPKAGRPQPNRPSAGPAANAPSSEPTTDEDADPAAQERQQP